MTSKDLDLRVLKSITEDKVNALQFAYSFPPDLFKEECRRFAKLAVSYTKTFRMPPTRRTLIERHQPNTDIVNTINSFYDKLDNVTVDSREYTFDLEQLKLRYREESVKTIRDMAAREADHVDNPDEFFKGIALKLQEVSAVEMGRSFIHKSVCDHIEEFEEKYAARKANPDSLHTVKTGYSLIDNLTGGLAPGELIIIGGETAGGKSMLLSNAAIQTWMQGNTLDTPKDKLERGYNTLFFSLEMPYDDCFARFLARMADIPQRNLLSGTLSQEEEDRKKKAYDFIEMYQKAGYYFDIVDIPRGLTIEEMELRYKDALLRYRPDIVVVDYMGLMNSNAFDKEQDWLKLGAIAAGLHEFARTYDVIMLTAAQLTDLKRSAQSSKAEEDKRVGVHRWGRSSLIMHNVNLGIQIETRPGEQGYPDLKYHIVKNRKGALGQGNMIKNFAHASLIDVPSIEEDKNISDNIQDLIAEVQKRREEEASAA